MFIVYYRFLSCHTSCRHLFLWNGSFGDGCLRNTWQWWLWKCGYTRTGEKCISSHFSSSCLYGHLFLILSFVLAYVWYLNVILFLAGAQNYTFLGTWTAKRLHTEVPNIWPESASKHYRAAVPPSFIWSSFSQTFGSPCSYSQTQV